jgi:hypothetical protein
MYRVPPSTHTTCVVEDAFTSCLIGTPFDPRSYGLHFVFTPTERMVPATIPFGSDFPNFAAVRAMQYGPVPRRPWSAFAVSVNAASPIRNRQIVAIVSVLMFFKVFPLN